MSLKDRLRRAALVILDAEEKPKVDAPLPGGEAAPAASSAPRATQAKVCSTCRHFDLAAGQAALRANPAMMGAAAQIPPWAMGRKIERDDRGSPIPPKDTDPALLEATWEDLGACKLDKLGRLKIDVCSRYEARGN